MKLRRTKRMPATAKQKLRAKRLAQLKRFLREHTWGVMITVLIMIALILFSTWFQGWLVGIIAKINWAWIQPLARTIAGLAAGFVQMVVLFPMEKFVLLKEKKKDGEEAAAEAAAE